MKSLSKNIKTFIVLSIIMFGFFGVVKAWNAVWHGTDWIKSGGSISAKKVAENFEYLKSEIDAIKGVGGVSCPKQTVTMSYYNSNINCYGGGYATPSVVCKPGAEKESQFCTYPENATARKINRKEANFGTFQCLNGTWTQIGIGNFYEDIRQTQPFTFADTCGFGP